MAAKIDVFTDKRRKLLSKTLMDVVKIVIAAAFASEFFFKFNIGLRIALAITIAGLIILGFLVCPKGDS